MNSGGFVGGGGDSVGFEVLRKPATLLEGAIEYYDKNNADGECNAERADEIKNIVQQFSAVDIYIEGKRQTVSRWQIYPPMELLWESQVNRGVLIKADEKFDMDMDGYLSTSEIAVAKYTQNPKISSSELAYEVKRELSAHIFAEASYHNYNDNVAPHMTWNFFGVPAASAFIGGIVPLLEETPIVAGSAALVFVALSMSFAYPLVRILDETTPAPTQVHLRTNRIQ